MTEQPEPTPPEKAVQTETKAPSGQDKLYEVLRGQLQEKERSLEAFRKQVSDLRHQNVELQGQLEIKEKELVHLREQIAEDRVKIDDLGNTIKGLRNKNTALEYEIEELKSQMRELRKNKKELQNKIQAQEAKNNGLEAEIDGLKAMIEEDGENKEIMQNQMNVLEQALQREQEKNTDIEKRLEAMEMKLNASASTASKSREYMWLSEMCRQVQNYMFEYFFPDRYEEKNSYKIEHIREEFESDHISQEKIQGEWNKFKIVVPAWEQSLKATISRITVTRNREAHPPITVAEIRKIIEDMERRGDLKSEGVKSASKVKKILNVWQKLQEHMEKK